MQHVQAEAGERGTGTGAAKEEAVEPGIEPEEGGRRRPRERIPPGGQGAQGAEERSRRQPVSPAQVQTRGLRPRSSISAIHGVPR